MGSPADQSNSRDAYTSLTSMIRTAARRQLSLSCRISFCSQSLASFRGSFCRNVVRSSYSSVYDGSSRRVRSIFRRLHV